MRTGDPVAAYDLRLGRWCRVEIVSINEAGTRATVAADAWWAVLPVAPKWIRPIAVVRA
jgi:hypothetical protein